MPKSNPVWSDEQERRRQLDDAIRASQMARFGAEALLEHEKADRVRRHFNAVARRYDLMNTLLSMGIHYLWKYQAVRAMDLAPGDRVLDVCGGTGDLSLLSRRDVGPKGQVVLLDINREMIRAGKAQTWGANLRNSIRYVQADAERIPFPDGTFDAVMVGFAIRNITHMKQAFQEMHRVLKPGGTFMCLEFSRPVWKWFRTLYDVYSFYIMPSIGEFFMQERTAYTRLPETIRLFLLPDELSGIFRAIGFRDVRHRLMTNGIAVMHRAAK